MKKSPTSQPPRTMMILIKTIRVARRMTLTMKLSKSKMNLNMFGGALVSGDKDYHKRYLRPSRLAWRMSTYTCAASQPTPHALKVTRHHFLTR